MIIMMMGSVLPGVLVYFLVVVSQIVKSSLKHPEIELRDKLDVIACRLDPLCGTNEEL